MKKDENSFILIQDKINLTENQDKKEEIKNYLELKENFINPSNGIEVFLKLMQNLKKNRHSLVNEFKDFLEMISKNLGYVTSEGLKNFLENPSLMLQKEEIFAICRLFDYENNGKFLGSDFTESYKTYLILEEQLQTKFYELSQNFELGLQKKNLSLNSFEQEINKKADFGYISKEELQHYFINELYFSDEIYKKFEILFNLTEKLVLISELIEKLKSIAEKKNVVNNCKPWVLGETVVEKLMIYLRNEKLQKNVFMSILDQKKELSVEFVDIRETMVMFKIIQYNLTFLETLLLFAAIENSYSNINERKIKFEFKFAFALFYEFFIEKIKIFEVSASHSEIIIHKHEMDEEINDINLLLNDKKQGIDENIEENKNLEEKEEYSEIIIQGNSQKDILKEEKINENMPEIEEFNNFQHQLKFKCFSMTLDLEKKNEGLNFKIRYYKLLEFYLIC